MPRRSHLAVSKMRVDTFAGGRRTNKTIRTCQYKDNEVPTVNELWSRFGGSCTPVSEKKVEAYREWLMTRQPKYGSAKKVRAALKRNKSIDREDKKQKKCIDILHATTDNVLSDKFPRRTGHRNRYDGFD